MRVLSLPTQEPADAERLGNSEGRIIKAFFHSDIMTFLRCFPLFEGDHYLAVKPHLASRLK